MKHFISASLTVAMLLGASACSGGNNTIPAASPAKQMRPAVSMPLYTAVQHKPGTKVAFDDLDKVAGSISGALSTDGSQASLVAKDSSGTTLASATTTDNGNGTISYQVTTSSGLSNFSALSPKAIHEGANALPGGGTMNVNSATGVATANVTGANGTLYSITATPNADGTATVEIVGSDGSDLSQRIAGPTGAKSANGRVADVNCPGLKDAAGYFGAVSAIAGGVAGISALTGVGTVSVAPVAAGISAGTAIIAGGAWLIGWGSGCPM